jgi:hypothetical protein
MNVGLNRDKKPVLFLYSFRYFYYKSGLFINLIDECFCLQQIQSRIVIPFAALRQ